ncbi:MAG: AAA family ATPase, partial [Caldilineae bacterium]
MRLVADLHIHSHYSRATSKDLNFEHLWKWAQIKGVHVVATGDIAHPGWLQEMREKLEPAEEGLFRLKPEIAASMRQEVPAACQDGVVRFLIGGEISNIYKKHGRTRKVHNVVFAPTLDATAAFQAELEKIGNIRSDGRPILGLDSRDLLEIALEVDPRCHLIPAHIWTPWFSLLGSKSGFDSVEECFEDLTDHIFALETGLSSDPPMNWRVSALDPYTLVSNSDAHSPPKLAREATLFHTELSYDALFGAMQSGDPAVFGGTIEFFPEEGKYHLDGHRKCNVCWEPPVTRAHEGRCPVCGKPVTVGVLHRVEELADRPPGVRPPNARPFYSLVPLPEILGEILGVGPNSKRVQTEYWRLLGSLGPELTILQETPVEDIAASGGSLLAEAIRRLRAGEVIAQGGYDGEYGVVRLFQDQADMLASHQMGLFEGGMERGSGGSGGSTRVENDRTRMPTDRTDLHGSEQITHYSLLIEPDPIRMPTDDSDAHGSERITDYALLVQLNPQQRAAATYT